MTGSGSKTVTVTGSLSDVNSTLAGLLDLDSSGASDTISLSASDSFGNTAGGKTVAVIVNGAPQVNAPASDVIGVSQTAAISGVSVTESGSTLNEPLTVVLTDTAGLLSANPGLGATVTGGGSTSVTIKGTFDQVDAALATLTDLESTGGSDQISVSATDGFGNAGSNSIPIGINGKPTVSAPAAATVGVGKSGQIAPVLIS